MPDEREKSDFLAEVDAEGQIVDFHALRHTFISNLARSGVHPKVAQQLARHSTITLTMDRYSHVKLDEQAKALAMLPGLDSRSRSDGRLASRLALPGSPSVTTLQPGASAGNDSRRDANPREALLKGRKSAAEKGLEEVRLLGLEPKTYGLKVRCSTD